MVFVSYTTMVSGAPIVVTYAYDRAVNLDTTVNDNGTGGTSDDLKHDYDYDELNRLKELHVTRNATEVFAQVYELASDGQRLGVVESRGAGTTATISWEYDANGRLISEFRDVSRGALEPATDGRFQNRPVL